MSVPPHSNDADLPRVRAARASRKSDRLQAIDVLRGAAVVGMALVHVLNAAQDAGMPRHPVLDELFVGKARFIFTLLFGGSLALQLLRAEAARVEYRAFLVRYARRLAALWTLFGLFCAAYFGNDILLSYAVLGLALPFFARRRVRVVLTAVLLCFAAKRLRPVAESHWAAAHPIEAQAAQSVLRAERDANRAQREEAFLEHARGRLFLLMIRSEARRLTRWRPYVIDLDLLGIMLLGLLAVRSGVLHAAERNRGRIAVVGLVGLGLWMGSFTSGIPVHTGIKDLDAALRFGFGILSPQWLGLAYAAGIILAETWMRGHGAPSRWLLGGFAGVGRMALTWFVLHQAVLTALFTPLGLNLRFPVTAWPAIYAGLTLGMFVLSVLWLRWARTGPLEWLWRCISELRWLPLRTAGVSRVAYANTA